MSSGSSEQPRAEQWRERGQTSTWRGIEIFHVEAGDPDAPLLALVHGFPTCSVDWFDTLDAFAERYRVTAVDFPGYGFSAKPKDWPYSLTLDAELLHHHITEVLGRDHCRVLAHDRGDSVALILHDRAQRATGTAALTIEHLALTNGNIFLPLAALTPFQKLLLDPAQAQEVLDVITPAALARGMGAATFTPPRGDDDPTVAALAATFAHDDGTAVLHDTIQYLRERADDEVTWLQALAASDVPTTVIWGICDTVAPPRVAMHVWEQFLRTKPGSNELWFVPAANHYVQNDQPDALVRAALASFERTGPTPPGALDASPTSPVRVDHSAPQLPDAAAGFAL